MVNVAKELNSINQTLENQNLIIQKMYEIMPKPAGKVTRTLETFLLFVGISSVVGVVDIIMKWIIGG